MPNIINIIDNTQTIFDRLKHKSITLVKSPSENDHHELQAYINSAMQELNQILNIHAFKISNEGGLGQLIKAYVLTELGIADRESTLYRFVAEYMNHTSDYNVSLLFTCSDARSRESYPLIALSDQQIQSIMPSTNRTPTLLSDYIRALPRNTIIVDPYNFSFIHRQEYIISEYNKLVVAPNYQDIATKLNAELKNVFTNGNSLIFFIKNLETKRMLDDCSKLIDDKAKWHHDKNTDNFYFKYPDEINITRIAAKTMHHYFTEHGVHLAIRNNRNGKKFLVLKPVSVKLFHIAVAKCHLILDIDARRLIPDKALEAEIVKNYTTTINVAGSFARLSSNHSTTFNLKKGLNNTDRIMTLNELKSPENLDTTLTAIKVGVK